MKKKKKLGTLKGKADTVFSKWIRARDKHICYTCGKVMQPKESQNGHYISRTFTSLRYDERNCHAQCIACNIFKKGNLTLYALRLETQYGTGILQLLEMLKIEPVTNPRSLFEQIIQKYDRL